MIFTREGCILETNKKRKVNFNSRNWLRFLLSSLTCQHGSDSMLVALGSGQGFIPKGLQLT